MEESLPAPAGAEEIAVDITGGIVSFFASWFAAS